MNNERCQCQDADDKGGHDVVECVELRFAAKHQRVLDVWEVLQHLQDKIHALKSDEILTLESFCAVFAIPTCPPA